MHKNKYTIHVYNFANAVHVSCTCPPLVDKIKKVIIICQKTFLRLPETRCQGVDLFGGVFVETATSVCCHY